MTITESARYWLVDFWVEHGDYRSSQYLMIRYGLPLPLLLIAAYVLFVTQLGPRMMANRPAYSLKWTLLLYNTFMVLLNFHFFIETLRHFHYGLDIFDFDYPPVDDTSEHTLKKVWMSHNYLMSKFLDLFDTIFFVLRKKQCQVTKTHLYHHISVPLLGWIAVRFVPTNNPLAIFAILNTFIHTIMHCYYGLSALGPAVRPYLWWKRYITQLQIGQFVVYNIFAVIFACRQKGYPPQLLAIAYSQPILFLILFYRFYKKAYGGGSSANRVKRE